MAHLARPKRAAEDFARSHHETMANDGPSSKKPRFDVRNPSALAPDALEDDGVLDADVIGSRGQQVRRNAVNIDGYDSDSENEGFDGQAAVKAKAREKQSKQEEEEGEDADMFADLEDDDKDGDADGDGSDNEAARTGGIKEKKKAVRFLDEDEIEGQVSNSKSGGHISAKILTNDASNGKGKSKVTADIESSSESEVDDSTRADYGDDLVDEELGAGGKKRHAPKLDAFNMRSEQEDGRFDDQGNYVRKAMDPDAVHDSWLEGTSKKDMRKAKEAAERREEERRRSDVAKDAVLTGDVLKKLIPLLERGETVLEALARLGKGKSKGKGNGKLRWQAKNKNKKKNEEIEDVEMGNEDPADAKRKAAVELITESADLLFSKDQPEIYDAERELLIRQYTRETGEKWDDVPDVASQDRNDVLDSRLNRWEYRWSDARDGGEIHGPYEGAMMVEWNNAGYFGDGVEFRRVESPESTEWSRAVDFV